MPRVRLKDEEYVVWSRTNQLAAKLQRDGGVAFTPGSCAALAALSVRWNLEPAAALQRALLGMALAQGALPGREVK